MLLFWFAVLQNQQSLSEIHGDKQKSKNQFKMENSVKKPFQCEICDSHFTREANSERHSLSVHERKMPFTCEICDYSCSQKSHLKHQNLLAASEAGCWKLKGYYTGFSNYIHMKQT